MTNIICFKLVRGDVFDSDALFLLYLSVGEGAGDSEQNHFEAKFIDIEIAFLKDSVLANLNDALLLIRSGYASSPSIKMYFPPLFLIPVFVPPPPPFFLSFSGSYCILPLSLLRLRCRFSFPVYIFLSLSTYLSPLALSPSFILVFHRLSFHLSFRPPLILFSPPFLQSVRNFKCSSRTPTRGGAGLAGGQLPVTPPKAGAGATAALQLRLTLASPKGAAASIRGASTAR
jgi:hypothetical protein